jgi:adenylate cyclase
LALVFAVAALYFVFAQQQFARSAHWYPLVIPLLLQVPLALFAAAWWRYHETNRERAVIRKAFGYHLPNKVVDQLARNMGNLEASRELLYGACLASDAARYTTLSERLDPATLAALMNRYYEALFGPVRAHGGTVSDVVGDAMLAIWAGARPDQALRAHACRAALEVARAAHAFGNTPGNEVLPTRIGVHAGQVLLGHVGGADHFEYRAVGDIVNTAARLQALNKTLGTELLASRETVEGLNEFLVRDLGAFLLPGKTQPTAVVELRGLAEAASAAEHELVRDFSGALAALKACNFAGAVAALTDIVRRSPQDGPARYFLALAERRLVERPDSTWDGIVPIADPPPQPEYKY